MEEEDIDGISVERAHHLGKRNVWFQKISIPLPQVFGLHPPTPSEFPFQGGL